LQRGLALLGKHDHHHGGLDPDEYAELMAIFPAYVDLSKSNDAHFAPPSEGVSPTGSPNHLSEAQRHLTAAYEAVTDAGADREQALDLAKGHAAFGAHFIAD